MGRWIDIFDNLSLPYCLALVYSAIALLFDCLIASTFLLDWLVGIDYYVVRTMEARAEKDGMWRDGWKEAAEDYLLKRDSESFCTFEL